MAVQHDLTMDQGAYWAQQFVYEDGDEAAIDITGWTAAAEIRPAYADETTDLYANMTTENGGITLGGNTGVVTLQLLASQTETIPEGRHYYDVELIPPAGTDHTVRLIQGRIRVGPQVTREEP